MNKNNEDNSTIVNEQLTIFLKELEDHCDYIIKQKSLIILSEVFPTIGNYIHENLMLRRNILLFNQISKLPKQEQIYYRSSFRHLSQDLLENKNYHSILSRFPPLLQQQQKTPIKKGGGLIISDESFFIKKDDTIKDVICFSNIDNQQKDIETQRPSSQQISITKSPLSVPLIKTYTSPSFIPSQKSSQSQSTQITSNNFVSTLTPSSQPTSTNKSSSSTPLIKTYATPQPTQNSSKSTMNLSPSKNTIQGYYNSSPTPQQKDIETQRPSSQPISITKSPLSPSLQKTYTSPSSLSPSQKSKINDNKFNNNNNTIYNSFDIYSFQPSSTLLLIDYNNEKNKEPNLNWRKQPVITDMDRIDKGMDSTKNKKMKVLNQLPINYSNLSQKFMVNGSGKFNYEIYIGERFLCSCPDYSRQGDFYCKHIAFIFYHLGLPKDNCEFIFQRGSTIRERYILFLLDNKYELIKSKSRLFGDINLSSTFGKIKLPLTENREKVLLQLENLNLQLSQPTTTTTNSKSPKKRINSNDDQSSSSLIYKKKKSGYINDQNDYDDSDDTDPE